MERVLSTGDVEESTEDQSRRLARKRKAADEGVTSDIELELGKHAARDVPDTPGNRYGSFVPVRENCQVKWYSNGKGFMSDVADAILMARKEIFITDWMLSPHIYLKRTNGERCTVKEVLMEKAGDGVKIFILLFRGELKTGIPWKPYRPVMVASDLAENQLKHKNIVVIRNASTSNVVGAGMGGFNVWSHHEKTVVIDQSLAFVGGIDLCNGRWDTHDHPLNDNYQPHPGAQEGTDQTDGEDTTRYQQWVGVDYGNTFKAEKDQPTLKQLKNHSQDYIRRDTIPRLPWHDIACCVHGEPARDVARHFIQRFEFTKGKQLKLEPMENMSEYQYLALKDAHSDACKCQVVRSVSKWSAGVDTERSIHRAYIESIKKAEHFIYIENQFFISSLPKDKIRNEIPDAIRDRIIEAHKSGKKFRVIIVLPQLPEFPGEFDDSSGAQLELVTYWTYRTIKELCEGLAKEIDKVDQYLGLYALQKHDFIKEIPVTELVYVHSKCMVVDDRVAIIGSANINERSMFGERDSEVCVVMEDTIMEDGMMAGQPYRVGKFSHSLRCHLYREHLGLVDKDDVSVQDPLSDQVHDEVWKKTAEGNWTKLKEVFGSELIADDTVETYEDLKKHRKGPKYVGLVNEDQADVKRQLSAVRGTLVPMQYRFLEDDLEELRKRKGLKDIMRWLPERFSNPIVKANQASGEGDDAQEYDDDPERNM